MRVCSFGESLCILWCMYSVCVHIYSAAVSTSAPPWRANPIYHRSVFDQHLLLHMRSSCGLGWKDDGGFGSRGSVEGFLSAHEQNALCQNSLFNTSKSGR
uniref:Secreted protein n=1 Tax=Schizaphis graminum TaxID=13262 RepID=A0A2S2NIG9_SCHGA